MNHEVPFALASRPAVGMASEAVLRVILSSHAELEISDHVGGELPPGQPLLRFMISAERGVRSDCTHPGSHNHSTIN